MEPISIAGSIISLSTSSSRVLKALHSRVHGHSEIRDEFLLYIGILQELGKMALPSGLSGQQTSPVVTQCIGLCHHRLAVLESLVCEKVRFNLSIAIASDDLPKALASFIRSVKIPREFMMEYSI